MAKQSKCRWALIFWTETSEITVVSLFDIAQVVKSKSIKIGWKGDLPWIDEYGITTIYEAKILKISRDKDYLLHLNVDVYGAVLQKKIPLHIMALSQELKSKRKQSKKAKESIHEKKQVETMALPNLHTISSESSNRDYISIEQAPERIVSQCEHCQSCVCKEWTSRITPEYVEIFGLHYEALKKHLTKLYPSSDLAKTNVVELYPGTKVYMQQKDIDFIVAKFNKKRAFVRNIVIHLIGGEENLLNSETAETMNSRHENIRTAVIGYMKKNFQMTLTVKEFNNIINHKIHLLRKNQQMTNEEKAEQRKASIERARKSRQKKDNNSKKRKTSTTSDDEQSPSASLPTDEVSLTPPQSSRSRKVKNLPQANQQIIGNTKKMKTHTSPSNEHDATPLSPLSAPEPSSTKVTEPVGIPPHSSLSAESSGASFSSSHIPASDVTSQSATLPAASFHSTSSLPYTPTNYSYPLNPQPYMIHPSNFNNNHYNSDSYHNYNNPNWHYNNYNYRNYNQYHYESNIPKENPSSNLTPL